MICFSPRNTQLAQEMPQDPSTQRKWHICFEKKTVWANFFWKKT